MYMMQRFIFGFVQSIKKEDQHNLLNYLKHRRQIQVNGSLTRFSIEWHCDVDTQVSEATSTGRTCLDAQ